MPNFDFKFERVVKTYETVHRVIAAATIEEASAKAAAMASEFNSECPDDAAEVQGAAEFMSWEADDGEETDEPADDEDEGAAVGGWFAVRYGPAGNVAGTIGAEQFDSYDLAEASARGKAVALGDGFWACVQEMNADGRPVGGL